MDWLDTDFDRMSVCAAPYGGPVAVIKQMVKFTGSAKPVIKIHTSAGTQISAIEVR